MNANYSDSIGKLDRLISDFDINVSLPYVKNIVKFATGTFKYFPRQILRSDRSTGLMTGGLLTWIYSSMLVQLQLCIDFKHRHHSYPQTQLGAEIFRSRGSRFTFRTSGASQLSFTMRYLQQLKLYLLLEKQRAQTLI